MGERWAKLSICVRYSVVQAGTWGLPSVEEWELALLRRRCANIMVTKVLNYW